jgi:hypothetical protein
MALCMQLQLAGWAAATTGDTVPVRHVSQFAM